MNYTHKMNIKTFKILEARSFNYRLKQNYTNDFKQILDNFDYLRHSRNLKTAPNKIEYIKSLDNNYGRNKDIKILLLLDCFLQEQKELSNYWLDNNYKELTLKLFNKYFEVSGGDYFKTISLKNIDKIGA